jgi:hypothetical protein
MGEDDRVRRRTLLAFLSTGAVGSVAGCSGGDQLTADTATTRSGESTTSRSTGTETERASEDATSAQRVNVDTLTASDVIGNAATLTGEVVDLGTAESVAVEFRVRGRANDDSRTVPAGTVDAPGAFQARVDDLLGASEYSYRAVALGDAASDDGEAVSFETGPAWKPQEPPSDVPLRDVVGVSHVDGAYNFTKKPFLQEGADRLAELGTDVVKVWFHRIGEKYPFNHDWKASYDSMRAIAETEPVQRLFEGPFSTYFVLAHSYTWGRWLGFQDGVTDESLAEVADRFEALATHLLERYDGTGKTFVLQHWEGDNLAQSDRKEPLAGDVAANFRRWLDARQRGVERARDRVESDVSVLHAAEVNFVLDAKADGTARVVNEVLPETSVDLVSYSAWELGDQLAGEGWAPGHNGEVQFDEAETLIPDTLNYVESHAADPNAYVAGELADGQSNVVLGEFGSPLRQQGTETAMRITRNVLDHSLDWGVRWAIYWQLYCNEPTTDGDVTGNDDVSGFHLIRPDGTRSPAWRYLDAVLDGR